MKKKTISLLLAGILTAGMCAGCGSSSSSESSSAASTAAETETTDSTSTETTEATSAETTESATTEADESSGTESTDETEYTVNEEAANDPAVTLTMAEVNPTDGTICGAMDLKFKEAVEAISGGSITIDLQASGVLGAEADVLDGMVGGTGSVDICRISVNSLNSYGATKGVLLSLPYTFKDRDHFWKFAESDLGKEILNEPSELGIGLIGLNYGEEGFRSFFTVEDKPVSTPEDMQGLKIRSSSDSIMSGMISALGATPSPVSMSEVYTSLQNGTIDGAEQPVANYASNSFYEVGPNLTLDEHTLGIMEIVISSDSYDSLTENQQQALQDAAQIAGEYCHKISEETENSVLEDLKAEGVNVIEVDDKDSWREACSSVSEEYLTDDDLNDLYQQILDMAE